MNRYKKALIITFHCINKKAGGTIASRVIINMFAEIIQECHLIYPECGTIEKLPVKNNVILHPCLDTRPKWLKGLAVYAGVLHRFHWCVIKFLNEHNVDLVVFDTTIVSHRLIKFVKNKGINAITIHHNVDRDYFKDNKPSFLIRLPYQYYIRKAEKESVNKSDLNLTLTEYDNQRLQALYAVPSQKDRFQCLGIYSDTNNIYSPPVNNVIKNFAEGRIKFIITGSLAFSQSEDSIIDFVKVYVPVINRIAPESEIIIAGSFPSVRLIKVLAEEKTVTLIPNPGDLIDIIRSGDVYLCPVDRGSGIKMRIMDGLRAGLPVITHENSCRGYEKIIDGNVMFKYNSVSSFEKALKTLLNTKFEPVRIYNLFMEVFSIDKGILQLNNYISNLLPYS